MLIQESMDEYVDEEYGIALKGLFALVTVEEGGALFDVYIGRGHCINYKGVTVNANENSRAVNLENLREEDENQSNDISTDNRFELAAIRLYGG